MNLLFKSNYGKLNIVCITEYLLGRSHTTSKMTSTSALSYHNVNESVVNWSHLLCVTGRWQTLYSSGNTFYRCFSLLSVICSVVLSFYNRIDAINLFF